MAAISIDGTPMTALPSDADQINYDNTSSGLSATQVQDAIDELASEKKDEYTPITYSQWQALTPAQQAAKDYYISDYPSSAITAGNVSYNNSSSGMSANNVQSAVDELKSGLTSKTQCVTISIDDVEFPSGRSGDFYANLPSQYASRTIVSAYAYSLSKAIKPYVSYVDNENKRVQYYTENSESSALTRSVTVTFLIV